jgi:hypothetical protein
MVAYLKAKSNKFHVASSKVECHINKYFHEMKVGDVDRSSPFEFEIVHGSKTMHQVWSISNKDLALYQYCQFDFGDQNHNFDLVALENAMKELYGPFTNIVNLILETKTTILI